MWIYILLEVNMTLEVTMTYLDVFDISEDNKKKFINTYKDFYFEENEDKENEMKDKENEKNVMGGVVIKHKTDKDVEKYADLVLNKKLPLDKRVFLWKAGRLTKEQANGEQNIEDSEIKNGRGNVIENASLFLRKVEEDFKWKGNFKDDYEELLYYSKDTQLKNVGAVYLITILFFLSNREYPIYDFFAHKAAKALFLGKNPDEVFVGSAPDKSEINKVKAMYEEYCYLLNNVFGYTNIERNLDRALWVYGHAKKEWKYN